MALAWSEDWPGIFDSEFVDLSTTSDRVPQLLRFDSRFMDPVSLWISGPGLRSSRYLVGQREQPGDFLFLAGIDMADLNARSGVPSITTIVPVMTEDGTSLSDQFVQLLERKLHMADPRLFLLPLHRRSVNPALFIPRFEDPSPAAAPAGRPDAIVGIIDHAINVAHERFRQGPHGTRLAFAWDQGGNWRPAFRSPGMPGRPLPFGCEWNGAQLASLIADTNGQDDQVLRKLGMLDFELVGEHPLGLAHSHGTHVLDLAAGMDPDDAAAKGRPIIAVNLPPIVARETSGSLLGIFFIQGLEYILYRARSLGTRVPVFINFSFGLSGGPRLGRHQLERSIDAIVSHHSSEGGGEVQIVFGAGNRNNAKGHATGVVSPGAAEAMNVTWHLQPADPTSNYLECWLTPADGIETVLLTLCTPQGDDIEPVVLTIPPLHERLVQSATTDTTEFAKLLTWPPHRWPGRQAPPIDRIAGRAAVRRDGGEVMVSLILAPTDPGLTGGAAVPPGDWGVTIAPRGNTGPVTIHAWVLRDDVPPGFPDSGRQSWFVDAAYRETDPRGVKIAFDPSPPVSPVRRAGTLNAIATADDPNRLVAGGYVLRSCADPGGPPLPASYSATPLEATDPAGGERVTHSAVTETSPILSGVLAAGARSGAVAAMNGTSVAAPQLVRFLVDSGTDAYPQQPRQLEPADTARQPQLGGLILPAPRSGRGGLPRRS